MEVKLKIELQVGEGHERTSRPDHIVRRDGIKNLLGIGGTLHIVQAGDEHVQLALAAFAECENLVLVVRVTDHTGYVPGAVEKEWC